MATRKLYGSIAALAAASFPAVAQVDCILQRHEEIHAPQSEPLRQVALKAEQIILGKFLPTLTEPVRLRTAIVIQDRSPRSAHLMISAFPKKSWAAGCNLITTIVGTAAEVNVYFNTPADEYVLDPLHWIPRRTGEAGGRPLYNGFVILSPGDRLPAVPETVMDWMDNEQRNQEVLLASARRSKDNAPGNAVAGSNLEMAQTSFDAYRAFRAKLTPEELASPWALATAEAEREWAPRIRQIEQLPADEQREVNERAQRSRALERQSVVERAKNKNHAEADRLMAESRALNAKNRELMVAHQAKGAAEIVAAHELKKLAAVRAVTPDKAARWKSDPGFFDKSNASRNRVQVIGVTVQDGGGADPKDVDMRKTWVKQVRDAIDYDALAKLLN